MRISDLLVGLCIFYKSLNTGLSDHCCLMWTIWYWIIGTSLIIDNLLWWIPLISLWETLKLFIFIAMIKKEIAEHIVYSIIVPLWKTYVPQYQKIIFDKIEKYLPYFNKYRQQFILLSQLFNNFFTIDTIKNKPL